MKWSATDPRDGWRVRFAFIPVKIGEEWIWLGRYERRFMGEYYQVRLLAAYTPREEAGEGLPRPDVRDAMAIYDLIDDPYIRARVRVICQQRDDAINEATVAKATPIAEPLAVANAETIARIIAPGAWALREQYLADGFPEIAADAVRVCLAKADAILALSGQTRSDEDAVLGERYQQALRNIAEGNLGDAPWQANYDRIREVAKEALKARPAPGSAAGESK